MPTVHCQRPLMATLFEAWLVGDEIEHLTAVGEAVLDEIERIENLLSRFDPTAEIYRVNQTAAARPVLVDYELYALLQDCLRRFEQTNGYFSVVQPALAPHKTLGSSILEHRLKSPNVAHDVTSPRLHFADSVQLVDGHRTVRFNRDDIMLDLGGYGKGYALDSASRILDEQGVCSAVVHGGTSSVLVRGRREDGQAWKVGLRDPFSSSVADEIVVLELADGGVSTSAILGIENAPSDIVDPSTGRPLERPAACSVAAASAVDAEVFSTALLAMGKPVAREYLERMHHELPVGLKVAWIEGCDGKPHVEWMEGAPRERSSS